MNSLVAYDDSDSDSEAEAGKYEDAASSEIGLADSAMRAVQYCGGLYTVSGSKGQPVECIGSSRRNVYHEDALLQNLQNIKKPMVTNYQKTFDPNLKIASRNHNHLLSSSMKPKLLSGNESCSQKRVHDDSDVPIQGLKPYIPKRMRLVKNAVPHEAECSGESTNCTIKIGTAEDRMSIKVSQYMMPYIGSKYGVTEIPKNLVFEMSDHSGPVNAVQWCPLQKWSHMLLSASMDKTVKVWDAVDQGYCLKTYPHHTCAVRAVQWFPCGSRFLSGGFDNMVHSIDIETGAQLFTSRNDFRISTLKIHPLDPNVFICGGFSPEVKAWDMRSSKIIKVYKAAVQQTLDIMFLPGGKEFLTSTDAVSQDSADRTIIAWDFHTAAKISNQIFHERYTCPSLTPHPKEPVFVAQTNGNYMALFSSLRPYRINKKKRYEGHKVEGFAVGCEFSPDGMLLVSGSSDGNVFFYNYHTSRIIRTLSGHSQACVSAKFHPVLPSLLATCGWDRAVKIWQ
ncbi:WD repeat-containing protein 25 isoform X2 [Sceloporus undulatus]|uniref:WD repeat-containing protein 25 isoform X2 n=1 Tax=Sceloporus undulatus TaxID=8520 RepID=UPI001C4AA97C|nr:WD repeat-containing protein 25 isoform X2 [Sceloporus undulatus]